MENNELSRIADLVTSDDAPAASVLTPEVRSGSSFTYSAPAGSATTPPFLLVWFYTVDVNQMDAFIAKVKSLEAAGVTPPTGVTYRGTYSVSISGAVPDLEFRTYWGLDDLGKLQNLNDFLHTPGQALQDVLSLIARRPVMRSEIMGRTGASAQV
jgi:hypothetical protein